jgi:hypothetical protein
VKTGSLLLSLLLAFSMNAQAKDDSSSAAKDERRFAPSYVSIEGHKKVTPDQWKDPRICGQCHSEQYEGWNGSMHSNAFKDPVYQALWALAEKSDPKLRNHCGTCHTPIGITTETVEFHPDEGLHGKFTAPEIAAQGVSCDVCHTISGTNLQKTAVLEHGNASFIMSPGDKKRATLKDAKSPYHDTEYSEHHDSSDFCGNCHNIFHPGNNFPIERTYDEWKYSIYAQNDIRCQDCHMVPVAIAEKVADTLKRPHELNDPSLEGFAALGGKWRKVVHKHGFVGGNAVVTEVLNNKDSENREDMGRSNNVKEAIARLKGAASLKLYLQKKENGVHQLKVKVTNERAGHHLPTSLTEVRQVWLEVVVKDEQGNELMRSGTLDQYNKLPKDVVIFNAHAVDINGQDTMLPWEIVRFVDVNTIPPKGYKYGKYYFNWPDSAKNVSVSAKLHYRSFSQGLADLLLGKDAIKVPSVEMVSKDQTFSVNEIKKAHDEKHADASTYVETKQEVK